MDADEIILHEDNQKYAAMLKEGTHTREDIDKIVAHKRYKQEIYLCKEMIKMKSWSDGSCTRKDTYLCLANALNGVNRRSEAIILLQTALEKDGQDNDKDEDEDGLVSMKLALAKLLFQELRKNEAFLLCQKVYTKHYKSATVKELAESYQLAGWIKIHSDDHTTAYNIWSLGACKTSDDFLLRQYGKRECWDAIYTAAINDKNKSHLQRLEDIEACLSNGLLGDSDGDDNVNDNVSDNSVSAVIFDIEKDLIAYQVPFEQYKSTSALSLFHTNTLKKTQNSLVFSTKSPLMSSKECKRILEEVENYHVNEKNGKWGTVRTSSVKTTDVAVEDIPVLRPWLRCLTETRLWPMLHAAYPVLADGTKLFNENTGEWRIRLHDAFIVRYDSIKDCSYSLPEHRDTSSMSFTLALNEGNDVDYSGGGTWFEALGPKGRVVNVPMGHATAFAGPLRHAGYPITSGIRMILVLFCYVEDFHYGPLVDAWEDKYKEECKPCCNKGAVSAAVADSIGKKTYLPPPMTISATNVATETRQPQKSEVRPSGDAEGGYVIYQQTTDLVEMLNREVVSVLE
jgi:hypothetical protein